MSVNRSSRSDAHSSGNSSNNLSDNVETEDIISAAEFLFNQVQLQQNARDNWYGHFLTIVSAVGIIATLGMQFYEGASSFNELYFLYGMIFAITGLIGFLFYCLYLKQRKNYSKEYRLLSVLQKKLLIRVIGSAGNTNYKPVRFGADFFTILIENIICSVCAGLSVFMFLNNTQFSFILKMIISALTTIFIALILYLIYYKNEKEIKKEAQNENIQSH